MSRTGGRDDSPRWPSDGTSRSQAPGPAGRSVPRPEWSKSCQSRGISRASPGPLEESFDGPGRDDPVHRYIVVERALGAVTEEVELPWRVRVGVDGEVAADLQRQCQQPRRRIAAFRA